DAAAKLYVHDASLSVVQDGSSLLGWTAFEPVLRERLTGAMRLKIGDVQVTATGGAAVVVAGAQRERTRDGATVTDDGVVTLVLRLWVVNEAAGWLIAAEHVSFQRRGRRAPTSLSAPPSPPSPPRRPAAGGPRHSTWIATRCTRLVVLVG